MPSNVTDIQEVTLKEKVLALRVKGADTATIAKELLVSEGTIRNILNDAWTAASANISKYSEMLVAFDIQRLEALIDKMMGLALDEDSMAAVDKVVKLINLKAKLLLKEQNRPITNNITGNIHIAQEQVFGVNGEEYALAIAEFSKDPSLLADHPKLPQIQAMLQSMNINKGTPEMDSVIEGNYELSDLTEDDDFI